ncbi:proline synthetase associated protein, putative [Entamoeba invadens IP1]|uniref:Pyridoxal phosphate homeostasis protein n=1 Tax=Entamoeba invadens IP1 TaxID=370355 RepID=A0A0A1U1M1_ENTIV|nr:proline synthetase associated protein, putative [Entamoeba invadens IP1]ELP87934.1 proline synthetase associated protein, putative [Entamoeba invadens IP1]|eukprot:XP_004254705.1 proline synthetase associated protein, putative [Entamoeba invadens IP1]
MTSTPITDKYDEILKTLDSVAADIHSSPATLIAVSKTKPKEDVIELFKTHHHLLFGENYIQELHEKATSLQHEYPDIHWHFIGRLQSNKVHLLVSTPNLVCIETVHSLEIAQKLDKELKKAEKTIDVFIQVNSSGEEQKGGVDVKDALTVYEEATKLTNLRVKGIMTIGMVGEAKTNFNTMKNLAAQIKEKLKLEKVEVSMGMSADYMLAAQLGATYVRVGSALFGPRNYNKNVV